MSVATSRDCSEFSNCILLHVPFDFKARLPGFPSNEKCPVQPTLSPIIHFILFSETCEDPLLFVFTGVPKYKYDKYNRRVLLLNPNSDNLFSIYLNLSASTFLVNIKNVNDYSYDGSNRILYYLNGLTSKVHSFNISSGKDTPVQALSPFSDIQALEIDIKNR